MDISEITESLRAARPNLLVAVDFDGTLAPLVPDPSSSRPADGTLEALRALRAGGSRVAVITGRDAHTVLRLSGFEDVPGIVVAGIYGIETWRDGELETPDTPEPMRQVQQRLPGLLEAHDADPAIWVEDKRLSLVVHSRRSADPIAALGPLTEPVGDLAADLGLELHPGRDVLELRLPGFDKAGALHRLVGDDAVVYLGDDLGDIPAFTAVRGLRAEGRTAWGIAVTSSGVPEAADAADAHLDTPADAVAFLAALAR